MWKDVLCVSASLTELGRGYKSIKKFWLGNRRQYGTAFILGELEQSCYRGELHSEIRCFIEAEDFYFHVSHTNKR